MDQKNLVRLKLEIEGEITDIMSPDEFTDEHKYVDEIDDDIDYEVIEYMDEGYYKDIILYLYYTYGNFSHVFLQNMKSSCTRCVDTKYDSIEYDKKSELWSRTYTTFSNLHIIFVKAENQILNDKSNCLVYDVSNQSVYQVKNGKYYGFEQPGSVYGKIIFNKYKGNLPLESEYIVIENKNLNN